MPTNFKFTSASNKQSIHIGFTGHRVLKHSERVYGALHSLLQTLRQQNDSLTLVSSAALGADTLFLEAARSLSIPYIIDLPFSIPRFEKDFPNDPENWNRIRTLLKSTIELRTPQEDLPPHEAYLQNGMRVVQDTDAMASVWNRQPAKGTGGTGQIVAYAQSLQRPIIIVDPVTGKIEKT